MEKKNASSIWKPTNDLSSKTINSTQTKGKRSIIIIIIIF